MRKRFGLYISTMLMILTASVCVAAGKAETAKFESLWKSPSPVVVPVLADGNGQVAVQFPAVPKKRGCIVVIRFKAYLKTPAYAGWGNYLSLDLNGKRIGAEVDGVKSRLLNREKTMQTQIGAAGLWKDGMLLSMFAPNGDELDPRIVSDRGEGCRYLMDISDLSNRVVVGWDDRIESQETNNLRFTSTYRILSSGDTAPCRELIVENLEAGYISENDVKDLRQATLLQMKSILGPSISAGDGKISVGKDGAVELRVGDESYYFTAAYSYPGIDAIRYNGMGQAVESTPDWKIVSKRSGNKIKVTGDWKDYKVRRTIISDGDRFRVYDEITNKTDKPLGMEIRYNTLTNAPFTSQNVFLCGSASLAGTDNCGTNPSIFIQQPGSSMGLVVEDTLFRLQMEVSKRDNSIEYASKHFGLEAHKSYTVEWTIYPSKSTDYWEFVNRVRRDWNVNYTLLGPCPFGDEYPLEGRKGLLYPMNPWYDFDSNNKMLNAESFKAIIVPKVKKLLAVQPDAIPMGMLNTNLVPFDTRDFGGNIPQGTLDLSSALRKGYGLELTADQTEFIKKSLWWDSVIKTDDGRAIIDTYYAPSPYSDFMVYPVVGNYQYKFMLWECDLLMKECGMKGVYMDQFNLAGINLKQPGRCDYSKWDGHTVDLKPNGEIARMFTDGTYVGSSARAGILRHIIDNGGVAMINGHPVERETRGLPVQSFAESEWDLSSPEDLLSWKEPPYVPIIAEGHLSSPISLGIRPGRFGQFGTDNWAEIIQKWVIACLKNGSLYCYYAYTIPTSGPGAGEYGIINHMYPFTPVELHSGWLIGKERILTAKSGSFYWNNPVKPEVLAFDSKGYQIKPENLKMVQHDKGWQVDLKINDWQETAVIKDRAEK